LNQMVRPVELKCADYSSQKDKKAALMAQEGA
jgi:hypothetical protein